MTTGWPFGERRIYYNNFAEHLLNAYNPNTMYPHLPHRWSDDDWRSCVDMVAAFGFNVFEFWLMPSLFSREALPGAVAGDVIRQMQCVSEQAHKRGMKIEWIAGLATVGDNWHTLFLPAYQSTAWTFDKRRADDSLQHLLRRLPDFPADTAVAINLGFDNDGNPGGERDARPWACAIAETNRILTWDFSLTEGENAILPHYRLQRLFAQRRNERDGAPYSGGICFTPTPRLNQLSLFAAARSFHDPDAQPDQVTAGFCGRVFGPAGTTVAGSLPLFEIVPDWGCHVSLNLGRETYHLRMSELTELLRDLKGGLRPTLPVFPSAEFYRQELLFFAELFAALTGPAPDYDRLRQTYWQHVYAIYDQLPEHVDPRPRTATDRLIGHFREWRGSRVAPS